MSNPNTVKRIRIINSTRYPTLLPVIISKFKLLLYICLTISRVPFGNPFLLYKFLKNMTTALSFKFSLWVGEPVISRLLKN